MSTTKAAEKTPDPAVPVRLTAVNAVRLKDGRVLDTVEEHKRHRAGVLGAETRNENAATHKEVK